MDIQLIATIAEVVAAFAAALAILFAVREFRHRKQDDLDVRIAELLGVSLTYTLKKPRPSEVRNGFGMFSYEFTVHNPGRLPISRVSVWICYPGPVHRVHTDDMHTEEPAESKYEMYVASVAAYGHFTWVRHLKVPEGLMTRMRSTTAEIWFRTPDVGEFMTRWPAGPETVRRSDALDRRLDQLKLRPAEARPIVEGRS